MKKEAKLPNTLVAIGWIAPVATLIGFEVADRLRLREPDDMGFGIAAAGTVTIVFVLSSVFLVAATVMLARVEPSRSRNIFLGLGISGASLLLAFLIVMLIASYA